MINEVRFSTEALNDFKEAMLWYAEIDPQLAGEFESEVEVALNLIQKDPLIFQVIEGNTRRMILRRFPFGIFYLIDDGLIIVTALMHHSRAPRIS